MRISMWVKSLNRNKNHRKKARVEVHAYTFTYVCGSRINRVYILSCILRSLNRLSQDNAYNKSINSNHCIHQKSVSNEKRIQRIIERSLLDIPPAMTTGMTFFIIDLGWRIPVWTRLTPDFQVPHCRRRENRSWVKWWDKTQKALESFLRRLNVEAPTCNPENKRLVLFPKNSQHYPNYSSILLMQHPSNLKIQPMTDIVRLLIHRRSWWLCWFFGSWSSLLLLGTT
jgi:hypothetical protein